MARGGPRCIDVTVSALDDDGLGEARYQDRRVVLRNALPGEAVHARILKRRRGVWFGEADTPVAAADGRQAPACPNYPRCGGCVLQHLEYPAQLAHKSRLLTRLLAEQGVHPQRFEPPVSGPRYHYRFKARLGVRLVGDELLVGFREGFSARVTRMADCKTLAVPFARMLPELQAALSRLRAPQRIPQVELAGGDGDCAVVIRHLDELDHADRRELTRFGAATGMRVFLQPGGYETVTPLDASAASALFYSNPELGLCFEFYPTDFTQVNPYVNLELVRRALLALAPLEDRVALDLFCGIGNFSLALARSGARVFGYESSPAAVTRARANAALNALSARAEFAAADLYDSRCRELPDADVLLLDPPRSGAGANLERWVRAPRLQSIVYVSCNPRTFASDAARLALAGFTLEEAGIFDMFPHTAHVEALGVFRRSGAPARG